MLVALDTGYEGKFDFPRRSIPPERTYLLATTPRTGSTWFSHMLWQSGCLGAPLEYLNFDPAGPYFFAAKSPSAQSELWRSALARRTSPNGVFGLKVFPDQLEALQHNHPELVKAVMSVIFGGPQQSRVIVLKRRDRVAQAISLARALATGVWRREQEDDSDQEVAYSDAAVDRAGQMLDFQLDAWEQMFAELRIQPLEVWYEDLLADPLGAIAGVAEHMGVRLQESSRVEVPSIDRQHQGDSLKWAARYSLGAAR
jgi:LPS sulfotransferase NodH